MPVVNIVFGLELILKGLAKQFNKPILHTHDLLDLFNALGDDIQTRIVDNYKTHDNYNILIALNLTGNSKGHGTSTLVERPRKDKDGVLKLLESHANYFEEFRYLFEFDDSQEKGILFRELSNLTFSALVVFGETLGKTVIYGSTTL